MLWLIGMRKISVMFFCFLLAVNSSAVALGTVSATDLVLENSWNTKTSMDQARSGLGVVAVEGKIYAIGGIISYLQYLNAEPVVVGTNERYDPKTDTWVTLEPMTTSRYDFAIIAYQNKIYCIGGSTSGVVEVYDITANSWSTKKSMPFDGGDLHANVVDGKIFVTTSAGVLDFKDEMQHLQDGLIVEKNCFRLFMYDPVADSWTEKTGVSTTLAMTDHKHVSTTILDKIIVISSIGHTIMEYRDSPHAIFTGAVDSNVLEYDPKFDVWNKINTAPKDVVTYGYYGIGVGVTTGINAPQRIYMFQGQRTDIYYPAKDVWAVGKSMPTERQCFGVATVDDRVYVIGGYVVTMDYFGMPTFTLEIVSTNEQYIPGEGTTYPHESTPPDPIVTTPSLVTDQPMPESPESKVMSYIIATMVIVVLLGAVGSLAIFQKKRQQTLKKTVFC